MPAEINLVQGMPAKFRVVLNGAVILRHGKIDLDWMTEQINQNITRKRGVP